MILWVTEERTQSELMARTAAGSRYDVRPTFDDMTVWLSRPLLYNRLLMAGKLP